MTVIENLDENLETEQPEIENQTEIVNNTPELDEAQLLVPAAPAVPFIANVEAPAELQEPQQKLQMRLKQELKPELKLGPGLSPELNKVLFNAIDEFKIFLVSGEYVRNSLEIDFTMGSHHYVSSYIPKDEVWLDSRMSEHDRAALIKHEIHEARLMKKGMTYPRAHALATRVEKKLRKKSFEQNCKLCDFL